MMANIFNNELLKIVLQKIPTIKVKEQSGNLIISHDHEDWDYITLLAQRLGFVTQRWMENQEPRTTIYLIN